jgi:predicted ester cyclase
MRLRTVFEDRVRCLSFAKTPSGEPVELPVTGKIVQLPEVSGLHHRYVRKAA